MVTNFQQLNPTFLEHDTQWQRRSFGYTESQFI
jgi:hypothetical protein